MSRRLEISSQLALPIAAVTEKLGFLGRTGSGKTYAAQKLAELMHGAGAQFVALDPVGVWWALRLAKDGKSAGIPLPVFGGLQGDVPLESTAGKLIADVVVDRGISAVIDVSQFESDAERTRFTADFGDRFFYRKKAAPSAVHLFIEEAQETLPQNLQRGEERMLHVWTRIWKLGRNYGIGGSLITQRPQDVNKKVLNQTELLFAFQITGPQERKAIAGWIEEKGLDEDIAADLPKLKSGAPHAWSPAWLNISKVITIAEKATFDGSSTPTVGTRARARELAPIDIAQLGEQIAASRERAKAEDPKELQKRIRELEAQLKKAPAAKADPDVIATAVERAVAEVRRGVVTAEKHRAQMFAKIIGSADRANSQVAQVLADLRELAAAPSLAGDAPFVSKVSLPNPAPAAVFRSSPAPQPRSRVVDRPSVSAPATVGDLQLQPSHRKILNALALMEQIGSPGKKVNLGFFAGYTEGGRFNNLLGELRANGLVEYPSGGMVALTAEGRAIADPDAVAVRSLADLHALWMSKLDPSEGKVLQAVLINGPPDGITKLELGERTGYVEGGRFNNILGRLRSLGAIDYPRPGVVMATDALFPEGLS